MSATTWGKFFWADWSNDPGLKLCSLAAQGLWMRCLCVAAEADPVGYVVVNGKALDASSISRLVGGISEADAASLLDELDRNGVFSRDTSGRIYSRRMVKDAQRRAEARKFGKMGGNPSLGNNKGKFSTLNPPDKGGDKGKDNGGVGYHKPYIQKNSAQARASLRRGSRGDAAQDSGVKVERDSPLWDVCAAAWTAEKGKPPPCPNGAWFFPAHMVPSKQEVA